MQNLVISRIHRIWSFHAVWLRTTKKCTKNYNARALDCTPFKKTFDCKWVTRRGDSTPQRHSVVTITLVQFCSLSKICYPTMIPFDNFQFDDLSNRPQVSVCKDEHEKNSQITQASDLRILRVFFQHPKWFISL